MSWEKVDLAPGRNDNPRLWIGNKLIRLNRSLIAKYKLARFKFRELYRDGNRIGMTFNSEGQGRKLGKIRKDGSIIIAYRAYDGPNHSQEPEVDQINGNFALIIDITPSIGKENHVRSSGF